MAQRVVEDIDPAFLDGRRIRPRADRARRTPPPAAAAPARASANSSRSRRRQRAAARLGLVVQKAQRGKLDEVGLPLPPQVQPDRRRHRQRAQPEPRIERRRPGHADSLPHYFSPAFLCRQEMRQRPPRVLVRAHHAMRHLQAAEQLTVRLHERIEPRQVALPRRRSASPSAARPFPGPRTTWVR